MPAMLVYFEGQISRLRVAKQDIHIFFRPLMDANNYEEVT